jgi:hypothetical protein
VSAGVTVARSVAAKRRTNLRHTLSRVATRGKRGYGIASAAVRNG